MLQWFSLLTTRGGDMHIGFRPNKKVQPFFETLTERGEKTRFLNEAIEFTLTYKTAFERQNEILEVLLSHHQDLINTIGQQNEKIGEVHVSIKALSEQICELNNQISALKETGFKMEQPKNEAGEDENQDIFAKNADFMGMALGDISL